MGSDVRDSKFLSLVLRHQPEKIGLTLDAGGWVEVQTLLAALRRYGRDMSEERLNHLVLTSDKQRFALEGGRIRANQGHSLQVDLGLEAIAPPSYLYHGTPLRFLDSITQEGLAAR